MVKTDAEFLVAVIQIAVGAAHHTFAGVLIYAWVRRSRGTAGGQPAA